MQVTIYLTEHDEYIVRLLDDRSRRERKSRSAVILSILEEHFEKDKRLGEILVDLGVRKVRLMTNNPRKVVALKGYGLAIVERVPLVIEPNELNARYLDTKRRKLGHLLEEPQD